MRSSLLHSKRRVAGTTLRTWLAPAELEAILLVSWSLGLLGETEKALFLFHQVWNYPKKKGWEDRMTQLLCPQAALVGMQLYQKLGEFQKAFDIAILR